MANYTANLQITTGRGESLSASKSGDYNEVFNLRNEVDNTDAFITLLKGGDSIAQSTLRECKSIIIKNTGNVGAEIQFQLESWSAATPDTNGAVAYHTHLLGAGDFMYLPNFRSVDYSSDTSAGLGATLTNKAPADVNSGSLYADTGVNLGANLEDSESAITVADLAVFKVGDLVQVGINDTTATRIEIMRVTAMSGTDGSGDLTVDRALYGTSKADKDSQTNGTNGAVSGANVYFPFFNTTSNYNAYSTLQTDSNGRLHIKNLTGYGRYADLVGDGFVPSSLSGIFYRAGYQELGLSDVTSSTHSGLAASTTYYFSIAADGGSAYAATFTTDSSNLNFGGRNGVIQKIQDVLDAAYYTAGNLFQKRVHVSIVNGDIRFTSGQRLSTSAIALTQNTAGSAGTDEFFDGTNAIGRIPASPEGAVAAKLPDDVVYDAKTNVSRPNVAELFYEDGHGNIRGACGGRFYHETGELLLTGCPPNANFVFSVNYGSAHAGGNEFSAATGNCILEIGGRSVNQKVNTTIEILGLN